jgi:hypothetical protein
MKDETEVPNIYLVNAMILNILKFELVVKSGLGLQSRRLSEVQKPKYLFIFVHRITLVVFGVSLKV